MGRKVHPIIFRIGHGQNWRSTWFADKNFPTLLREDEGIRIAIKKALPDAGIALVEIKRSTDKVTVIIHSSKPGIVIGRGGAGIDELKAKIQKQVLKNRSTLQISIQEIKQPNLSAEIVLQGIAQQLEKRMPFRRILKNTVAQVMEAGAEGVKVSVAGRLNGADIARTEKLGQGRLPLHTLRADIDYAVGRARTTYGAIGVKVWIYRGLYKEVVVEEQDGKATKKS